MERARRGSAVSARRSGGGAARGYRTRGARERERKREREAPKGRRRRTRKRRKQRVVLGWLVGGGGQAGDGPLARRLAQGAERGGREERGRCARERRRAGAGGSLQMAKVARDEGWARKKTTKRGRQAGGFFPQAAQRRRRGRRSASVQGERRARRRRRVLREQGAEAKTQGRVVCQGGWRGNCMVTRLVFLLLHVRRLCLGASSRARSAPIPPRRGAGVCHGALHPCALEHGGAAAGDAAEGARCAEGALQPRRLRPFLRSPVFGLFPCRACRKPVVCRHVGASVGAGAERADRGARARRQAAQCRGGGGRLQGGAAIATSPHRLEGRGAEPRT